MASNDFLERVFAHMSRGRISSYKFVSWRHANRPTSEGLGQLPVSGVDPEAFIARVMDVDRYVGNVEHVLECRAISDERYQPPTAVRLYEKINVPMLAKLHMELALEDQGERDGFRVVTWRQLDAETAALSPKVAARSDFNLGVWLIKPDQAGYALGSAPRREDVGLLKFKALTKGADAIASKVIKATIEGMVAWSRRA